MENKNNNYTFKCYTQDSNESCGSLGSVKCYLINSQADKRYRVTVRKSFNRPSMPSHNLPPINIEAGGRILVGCNKTTTNGYDTVMISYEVVGEIKI